MKEHTIDEPGDYERDDTRYLLALLSEYSGKLKDASETYLSIRSRMTIVLVISIVSYALLVYFLIASDLFPYFSPFNMSIFLAMTGVLAFSITIYNWIGQLSKIRTEVLQFSSLVERLISRASKIEEYGKSNITERIEFDLRLAEAEMSLKFSSVVLRRGFFFW